MAFFSYQINTMQGQDIGPKKDGATLKKESGAKNVEVRQVGYRFHCCGACRWPRRVDRSIRLSGLGRLRRHDPNACHYARGDINEEQLQVCTFIGTVLNYSITSQLQGARSRSY
jgi:hypothetical protein